MTAKSVIIYVFILLITMLAVALVDEFTLGKNSKYVQSLNDLIASQDEYIKALEEQNKWLKIKCDLFTNDRIEDDLK